MPKLVNNDFQWHRLSDVTRDVRRFAEEWKVNVGVSVNLWEGEVKKINKI